MNDAALDTSNSEAAERIAMLRDSAADFVQRNFDTKKLRARRGQLPGFEPAAVQQMAELGWLAILVPEEHGGLGLGFGDMAAVLEELGKGLLAEPLAATVLAARVIQHGDNEALKSRLLAGIADGSALPCVAWQEGLGGVDPVGIRATAREDGGSFVLDGSKRFVAGSAGATGFVVSAMSAQGLGLFWIDAGADGVELSHEWRADETPSGVLALNSVRVPAANSLCDSGPASEAALTRAIDEAAVMASAEMLGVMEAALTLALGYMRTRVQFDKPIGSFQALQHKTADLYVQQELLRAVLDDAIRELDSGHSSEERAKLASRCKSRAGDAGMRVTREVIQLHGAIGYTDEYDAGLYLKRALVLSGWLGNSSVHRRRFARLTGGIVTV